jgi:uncharacterized paraquat-inducible protein A
MATQVYRGHRITVNRVGKPSSTSIEVVRLSDGFELNPETRNHRRLEWLKIWDVIRFTRDWLDREIEKGKSTYDPDFIRATCPKCEYQVEPKSMRYCPYCGTNLEQLSVRNVVKRKPGYRWCPRCQTNRRKHLSTEPKAQVYYCHECGTKLKPTFKYD